ncbi:MAG: pyruvate:ferredoxin (flavodoxin) oxidoreductase [Deltaproteobacteria bacterium]|nr:pyruvate:ferredoxin (flavodoxin) oxidoreductase [Deltaproteobacteria bacterium]
MAERLRITVDGNEAASSVAHRCSEVIAIYPITPSSSMGEFADEWSAAGRPNIWGTVPDVVEMQSEGGAAGAVHGALQAGALTTTFTASQGLLLMIPNMYKIAGEYLPFAMHVSARTLATHALSIFGDHSDVMACRQIGFALLSSNSGQEVHDLACIAHAATLKSRVPFLHFFDGFRTSSEVTRIEYLSNETLLRMMDPADIAAHRMRALTPDRPVLRGTAQNPDTFFQQREAGNHLPAACPGIVQATMDRFAELTGRAYHLFDYVGHPEAERVVVLMGSGAETAHETVEWLVARGEKVGLLKVRLYRPFSVEHFVKALPASVTHIAVLDRTKEPGSIGEPLYLDVMGALHQARKAGILKTLPTLVGGRFGLSSKEFTPAMVKAVLDNLCEAEPRNHFSVGIEDDVHHESLPYDHDLDIEPDDVKRAVFVGLGADGTVGANKNSIKIIGEETEFYPQGYFVYDSRKSGSYTISHLRFGPRVIRSPYLVKQASFVACHQFVFLEKLDVLKYAAPGAVFLLNSPYGTEETWDHLPREVQRSIVDKRLRFFVIDAYAVARETEMGTRINTVMQTCFFAISGVLPQEDAIRKIKGTIQKTYGRKGEEVVRKNFWAVDQTLANLHEVEVPRQVTTERVRPPVVSPEAPAFVRDVIATMLAGEGDRLPVSAFTVDGTWPTATTQWEKRSIAQDVPIWDPAACIQCAKCSLMCPHAAIRPKVFDPALLADAPASFRSADAKGREFAGLKWVIQVAPEDCTGCGVCVGTCPGRSKTQPNRKAINLEPLIPVREQERENYAFFLGLPDLDRTRVHRIDVKGSQLFRPLFEYSGACAGCGETPYVKLMTQLFGDRLLVANATGCSSIYGGNLPTTPYCQDAVGRGPAWCNSLFEDNAEFGFGFRLALDANARVARDLLVHLERDLGEERVHEMLTADQTQEAGIAAQRARVAALKEALRGLSLPEARRLEDVADYLVRKTVWIVGGDGWAYDIGYGGLDHVIANKRDINILVLNTEVYSNTGGQASKATPMGASAKFAISGKEIQKKDLGLVSMVYGNAYVAAVAMGARDLHTVRAFQEADSYRGPSIILAYCPCIAHGYDLAKGPDQSQLAVDSGLWPLYRYDPRRVAEGKPPLQLDSREPKAPVLEFMRNETRFRMVERMDAARFHELAEAAQLATRQRYAYFKHLSELVLPFGSETPAPPAGPST